MKTKSELYFESWYSFLHLLILIKYLKILGRVNLWYYLYYCKQREINKDLCVHKNFLIAWIYILDSIHQSRRKVIWAKVSFLLDQRSQYFISIFSMWKFPHQHESITYVFIGLTSVLDSIRVNYTSYLIHKTYNTLLEDFCCISKISNITKSKNGEDFISFFLIEI